MISTSSGKNMDQGGIEFGIDKRAELNEIFYIRQKKGYIYRVKLNVKGLFLQQESTSGIKNSLQTVNINDIVGGRCMRLKKTRRLVGACRSCSPYSSTSAANITGSADTAKDVDNDASAYMYVFAYVLKKGLRHSLRRERTVLTLRFRSFDDFEENMREAERWYKMLKWYKHYYVKDMYNLSNGHELGSRRLLIMLNPKSGSGKARDLFHHQMTPVLNEAELLYDVYVTKNANDACEFVRVNNLSAWCGIVAVGGDGLFYEILNGLIQRPDWEMVLKLIPLGIVPCGSGNGLAKSISHLYKEPYESNPILGAALTVVSGRYVPIDVVRIELKNKVLYSFLSVGWGLISDIDIESESLRGLGYQRFTLWTLHRLINLRTYRGRVSYLEKEAAVSEASLSGVSEKSSLKHGENCCTGLSKSELYNCYQSFEAIDSEVEFGDVISLDTSTKQSLRSRCGSWLSVGSKRSTYYSIAESVYHSITGDSHLHDVGTNEVSINNKKMHYSIEQSVGPNSTISPLHDPVPELWTIEEGEFIMVHAAYQSHLSSDCFFAPAARFNDGIIYMVIIRAGISRTQLLQFLINMSSGTHLPTKPNDFVKVVAVTAFRIEPYANDGIITVDGERVTFGSLQGEICPGIANIMVPN